MRKNLATALSVLAALFFVGASLAEAVDFNFGGEIRERYEMNGMDYNPNTPMDKWFTSRVRFDAGAKLNDSTSAFIQMQSVNTWGANGGTGGTCNGVSGANCQGLYYSSGTGQAGLAGSDNGGNGVGIHQAYVVVKNFFTIPVDLKVGRQIIALDGHRLLGDADWTPGGRTHDAILLSHAHDNMTFVYAYSKAVTSGRTLQTGDILNTMDADAHVLWANFKNLPHENSSTSLYFIAVNAGGFTTQGGSSNVAGSINASGVVQNGVTARNNIYTYGFRQEGKKVPQAFGIDYRGEFYYQGGQAETDSACAGAVGDIGVAGTGCSGNNYYKDNGFASGKGSGVGRSAYMYGLRLGKQFDEITWKPSVTLWYDYLSGTTDNDIQHGRYGTFNTLFSTGHKYYGLMNNFLPSATLGTSSLGLRDFAGKLSVEPLDSVKVNLDMHQFWTATNLTTNPMIASSLYGNESGTGPCPSGSGCNKSQGSNLGQELDLTVTHKYNQFTTFMVGYSHYWATDLFHAVSPLSASNAYANGNGNVGTSNSAGGDWAYVQMDVKF